MGSPPRPAAVLTSAWSPKGETTATQPPSQTGSKWGCGGVGRGQVATALQHEAANSFWHILMHSLSMLIIQGGRHWVRAGARVAVRAWKCASETGQLRPAKCRACAGLGLALQSMLLVPHDTWRTTGWTCAKQRLYKRPGGEHGQALGAVQARAAVEVQSHSPGALTFAEQALGRWAGGWHTCW